MDICFVGRRDYRGFLSRGRARGIRARTRWCESTAQSWGVMTGSPGSPSVSAVVSESPSASRGSWFESSPATSTVVLGRRDELAVAGVSLRPGHLDRRTCSILGSGHGPVPGPRRAGARHRWTTIGFSSPSLRRPWRRVRRWPSTTMIGCSAAPSSPRLSCDTPVGNVSDDARRCQPHRGAALPGQRALSTAITSSTTPSSPTPSSTR